MSDDLWDSATRDIEAESRLRDMAEARAANAETWHFLASATSERDFENRLALVQERITAPKGTREAMIEGWRQTAAQVREAKAKAASAITDQMMTWSQGTGPEVGDTWTDPSSGKTYTVTQVTDHTISLKDDEGWEMSPQRPFNNPDGSPTPHWLSMQGARKTAKAVTIFADGEGYSITVQVPDAGDPVATAKAALEQQRMFASGTGTVTVDGTSYSYSQDESTATSTSGGEFVVTSSRKTAGKWGIVDSAHPIETCEVCKSCADEAMRMGPLSGSDEWTEERAGGETHYATASAYSDMAFDASRKTAGVFGPNYDNPEHSPDYDQGYTDATYHEWDASYNGNIDYGRGFNDGTNDRPDGGLEGPSAAGDDWVAYDDPDAFLNDFLSSRKMAFVTITEEFNGSADGPQFIVRQYGDKYLKGFPTREEAVAYADSLGEIIGVSDQESDTLRARGIDPSEYARRTSALDPEAQADIAMFTALLRSEASEPIANDSGQGVSELPADPGDPPDDEAAFSDFGWATDKGEAKKESMGPRRAAAARSRRPFVRTAADWQPVGREMFGTGAYLATDPQTGFNFVAYTAEDGDYTLSVWYVPAFSDDGWTWHVSLNSDPEGGLDGKAKDETEAKAAAEQALTRLRASGNGNQMALFGSRKTAAEHKVAGSDPWDTSNWGYQEWAEYGGNALDDPNVPMAGDTGPVPNRQYDGDIYSDEYGEPGRNDYINPPYGDFTEGGPGDYGPEERMTHQVDALTTADFPHVHPETYSRSDDDAWRGSEIHYDKDDCAMSFCTYADETSEAKARDRQRAQDDPLTRKASKTAAPLDEGIDLYLNGLEDVARQARENTEKPGLGVAWAEAVENIVGKLRQAVSAGYDQAAYQFAMKLYDTAIHANGDADMPASIAAARAVVNVLLTDSPAWLDYRVVVAPMARRVHAADPYSDQANPFTPEGNPQATTPNYAEPGTDAMPGGAQPEVASGPAETTKPRGGQAPAVARRMR